MSSAARVQVLPGESPLVLVAPHGGRRDAVRRPWISGQLKVNDLHTAALTTELAALTGGTALVNAVADRNDVDLNRIGETYERAPEFLEHLQEALESTLARHGRATLLTVHGWNVVQPVVDVGLGCRPGADPFAVGRGAAVSPAFAETAVRRLVDACGARGIGATVGARYPARNRENLLQLFTPRYRDDPRPLIAALAGLAPRVEAMQLELGIALRWPGPWRERFIDACRAVLRDLTDPGAPDSAPRAMRDPVGGARVAPVTRRFEFTSPTLCGLVGLDAPGGRMLLFPPRGGLALFTGERTGGERAASVGALDLERGERGLGLRFRGPLLTFPDTTPFLDLETGLASADLVDAEVEIDFTADEPGPTGGAFGQVRGRAVVAGASWPLTGHGFAEEGAPPALWPRLRAAFRLGDTTQLALTLALQGGEATGFVSRRGEHIAVATARATLGPPASPLDRIALELELVSGERMQVAARAIHRLPVVRVRGPSPVRLEFAACRLEDGADGPPAGWCEVGGI